MKTALCLTLFSFLSSLAMAATPAREITISTEKKDDGVHWSPEMIEVTQGEKVKITAKHELEGGFDFHGLFIPELKISEKVERNKPTVVERTIPKTLKAGKYKIGCQFHEKHVAATLVVNAPKKDDVKPAATPTAADPKK